MPSNNKKRNQREIADGNISSLREALELVKSQKMINTRSALNDMKKCGAGYLNFGLPGSLSLVQKFQRIFLMKYQTTKK